MMHDDSVTPEENNKDEIAQDRIRATVALSTSEVVSRFGSANAEYLKGYSGIDHETGQTFAKGLVTIGTIDAIIQSAQTSGFGAAGMILVMISIIAVSSVLMGSGNAPFFAFAALTPTVAAKMSVAPVVMLLPMHFAASAARAMSPITAVIVVSSSMGGVSPFDVVKRTAIPMAGALITLVAANFIFFY